MPLSCPRPCGRLATAAIFISIGVVQLTAGIILSKSRYVYLVSAPDFWTAFCNFAVGGLLGVSTGVWKSTGKKCSKHSMRRNVIAALVASSILMNLSTLVILMMGEGETLLLIHLEKEGFYTSATLASEILAYAYAASVCSPIFAVVVAILYLTGMCFSKCGKSLAKEKIVETGPTAFNWVYKPERRCLPKPDPEIVRRALSSKSFASSKDSTPSSTSEFPPHPDLARHFDTSLKNGIRAIGKQNANELLQRIHQCVECIEDYPDLSESRGNRNTLADDLPGMDFHVHGTRSQKRIKVGIENCSESCDPSFKLKKKSWLSYEPRDVYVIEKFQKLGDACHSRDASSDASITSVLSNRNPTVVSAETPPGVVKFGESLHCFEHQHLRRTSTGSNLVGIPAGDIDTTTESIARTMVRRTVSGESYNNAKEQSSLNPTDLSIDSREDSPLHGEMVPIRVNTFPRKKLPVKLIPVSIPMISRSNACRNEQSECKFEESRKNGLSSFHGGCQMKNRSKSTGSQSIEHSVPTFSAAKTAVAAATSSDAAVDGNPLQLSLTHTSGYVSAVEDSTGPSSVDSSESNGMPTSNASSYARCESSGYASARRKFRAAQRKILDGGRPLSPKAIDDIVKGIIDEIPLFSKI